MDIRSLIGPSNTGADKSEASSNTTDVHSSAQEAHSSPHETSSPVLSSRRQTVSSLLNDDESDYLKTRVNSVPEMSSQSMPTSKSQASPTLTSRLASSPIGERSQSPVTTRSRLDSPDQRSKSSNNSPSIPKKPLLADDMTSPRTKSAIPGARASTPIKKNQQLPHTTPTPPPAISIPKRSESLNQEDSATSQSLTSEEGNSSPPVTRRESREGETSIGHLPPKPEHRSSVSMASSPTMHDHTPSFLPSSLPPPPKAPSSNSPTAQRNIMHRASEPNGSQGNGHNVNSSNGEIQTLDHVKGEAHGSGKSSPLSLANSSSGSVPASGGVKKPKRYDVPPIWAQNFRELNHMRKVQSQNHLSRNGEPKKQQSPQNQQQHQHQQQQIHHSFPRSKISNKSELPVSLTDVLPFEDLTRKITEWLFAILHNLGEDRQYVEVEVKLGRILSKKNDQRIDLPVITETVIKPDYARSMTHFQSAMSEGQFKKAATFLDGLAKDSKANPTKPTAIVAYPANFTKDVIFQQPGNGDDIRVTFNKEEEQVERIVKRKIDHMVVYSPGDLLDFRITVSLEIPQTSADLDLNRLKAKRERIKNRLSYLHRGFQADLTSVTTDQTTVTKELELEINKSLILEYFDSLSRGNKDASFQFEELVRFTVDNTRLILRKLSR